MSLFSSVGQTLFGVPPVSSSPYSQQAQQLQQQAQQYAGREQSDYNNEAALAAELQPTINGTAPSAADMQLTQSFGQNLNNGLAAGSGATGSNAVLARYLASQATGTNGAQLAQAAAIQRAKEAESARQQQAGIYGNMNSSSAGLYGTNLTGGLGYSGLANNVDQSNAQRSTLFGAAGLQAAGGIGSMIFGRSPSSGGSGKLSVGDDGYSNASVSGDGYGGLNSSDPDVSNQAWGS